MEIDPIHLDGLPDPDAARRLFGQLSDKNPAASARLTKDPGLLSDVLTLAAFSPLLAATMLENPQYISWLGRRRRESGVRSRDELTESLAQFTLTHSTLEPQMVFARFRRRELLRIYLRDIRHLATVAEITEEISNLADAVLEAALSLATVEADNRFGQPQEIDDRGRSRAATFCIVALGKLGSRELNYSSDIDLVFLYSGEGTTTGTGSRGMVTNREYFAKLAEYVVKLVGQRTGEEAAYRVDLRLRPHGSIGVLALSVADTVRYYEQEARPWERQVLIRSRAAAGDDEIFRRFAAAVEPLVFSDDESVDAALSSVRRSKELIDQDRPDSRGFNVKLGRGGIREIEFIAQALQLAYGGTDRWLRSSHTLISLARLSDRGYLSEDELTELAAAYEFLRRTEHIVQMENGLQTHTIPEEPGRRAVVARRVEFAAGGNFAKELERHTANVTRAFLRVFGEEPAKRLDQASPGLVANDPVTRGRSRVITSARKGDIAFAPAASGVFERLTEVSPYYSAVLAANPRLAAELPDPGVDPETIDYRKTMIDVVETETDFGSRLAAMRRAWIRRLLEIVVKDVYEKITIAEAKRLQTELAEASIAAALVVTRDELSRRYAVDALQLDLAVMALGKLGGRGVDYDSDLDLVMVYFDPGKHIGGLTASEFYSRAVELFTTTLSSMTRDGSLYRVDLRLRPFGSKGLSATSIDGFLRYMQDTAAIWELLAFVKLRFAGGDASIGVNVENETRRSIHERAVSLDPSDLARETRRVRLALEERRQTVRRAGDVDIKYGPGGMLDVYFAMRFLQLRDNVPDDASDRSTAGMLAMLRGASSLDRDSYEQLLNGYQFLSELDHGLRLTVGRTTRVPFANTTALDTISQRMHLGGRDELLERLTLHRLAIRDEFDKIVTA